MDRLFAEGVIVRNQAVLQQGVNNDVGIKRRTDCDLGHVRNSDRPQFRKLHHGAGAEPCPARLGAQIQTTIYDLTWPFPSQRWLGQPGACLDVDDVVLAIFRNDNQPRILATLLAGSLLENTRLL